MIFQPFHLVNPRPWPILRSFYILFFFINFILLFHYKNFNFIFFSFFLLLLIIFQWWRDIIRESTFQGNHTLIILTNLKLRISLFIIREIFFFIRFFWTYFHNFFSPDIEIGLLWPPSNILIFNPFHIPLLNTIILLSSGFSITWSHHSLINKNLNNSFFRLFLTVFLGFYFSFFQLYEYNEAFFSINDSIFGSIFFLTTGFHGIHVLIGTSFLFINLIRIFFSHFNKTHHFSFEAAAWYWHFVDIVWIFLYTFFYWWIF